MQVCGFHALDQAKDSSTTPTEPFSFGSGSSGSTCRLRSCVARATPLAAQLAWISRSGCLSGVLKTSCAVVSLETTKLKCDFGDVSLMDPVGMTPPVLSHTALF